MFSPLNKEVAMAGSVFFRGSLPLRREEFESPRITGIRTTILPDDDGRRWALRLEHEQWGRADLFCLKDEAFPPRELLELDPRLTPEQVATIAASRTQLSVRMASRTSQLRERKKFLRLLDAILGPDDGGIAAVDHLSQRFWPREALEDELSHDADLDVEALYCLHDVHDEPDLQGADASSIWLHSHGLGELGLLDFDMLRVHPENRNAIADLSRALAFAIIEGRAQAGKTFELGSPDGTVRLVDAATYMSRASSRDAALRDDPDGHHVGRRVVLCDPDGPRWRRWLGRDRPRPSSWFQRVLAEETVFSFSNEASDLMRDRARHTYSQFRAMAEEFADLDLPVLAKLGYPVDGGSETDLEHLWFRIERCHADRIEAVLENQPFGITRMKQGDRGEHAVERMSDWTIFSPVGPITPREFSAARRLRTHHREIRELMLQQRTGSQVEL